MRGRKPKPSHIKLLTGNPGKRPINADEPVPEPGGLERPPAWLNKGAKLEWKRVMKEAPRGLLTRLDRQVVAMYCQTTARIQELEGIVDEQGYTFMSEKGFVIQRPEMGMLKNLYGIQTRLCAEMGFSPSSRSRVKVTRDAKPKGKLSKFIA